MSGPGIYVASPLGFSEPGARYLNDILHPSLRATGFEVLDPWSSGAEILASLAPGTDAVQANARLGAANAEMIERSAAVLAVLDGADVDSGTAAEIGFASALGRCVIGLRTDFRMAGDNAAAPVNLQVLHFIKASGGHFTTSINDSVAALRVRFVDRLDGGRIFHVAERRKWEAAKRSGTYRESTREQTLEEVGFIHCSFEAELAGTIDRFYSDVDPAEFAVLVIDPERLTAEMVVEPAGGATFPHIYGPLNSDAVVARIGLVAGERGLRPGRAAPA